MSGLPRQDQARILSAIKALAKKPRSADCRPVKAAEKGTYRVRVGNYRVVLGPKVELMEQQLFT